jgi:hypothetical protein
MLAQSETLTTPDTVARTETETLDPAHVYERLEIELARFAKSSTLTVPPARAHKFTDRLLPSLTDPFTEKKLP